MGERVGTDDTRDSAGRDMIVYGDNVYQDKVAQNKYVFFLFPPMPDNELRYDKLIENARDRLRKGILPQFRSPTSPLSYYQLIRPSHFANSLPQEVEVWVSLISNVPQRIRVLKIEPPDGIDPIRPESFVDQEIEPFGVLPALRYVMFTTGSGLDSRQPRIVYQVSGDSTLHNVLSEFLADSIDDIALFVPFVDREELLVEMRKRLKKATEGTPQWLAIAGKSGEGRSRGLTECISSARRLGFDVLKCVANPAEIESEEWDPIREALVDRLEMKWKLEDDVFRLVWWLEHEEPHGSQEEEFGRRMENASIGMMTQYLREGVEDRQHFEATASGILQRACKHPLLLGIDDLHNAPPSTFDVIHSLKKLLPTFPNAKLIVCVTYDLKCDTPVKTYFQDRSINLQDLSETDVLELTQRVFPTLAHQSRLESLAQLLGGKPLLVRHGLGCLSRAGYIRLKDGRWQFEMTSDQYLNLRQFVDEEAGGLGILWAEYKRLPFVERQILQVAAAIGTDFESELLEDAMLDSELNSVLHKGDISCCIDALKSKGFILPLSRKMYKINPSILRQLILGDIQRDSSLASKLHSLIARLLAKRAENDEAINARLAYQLLWTQEKSRMKDAFHRFRKSALGSLKLQHLDNSIALFKRAFDAAERSQGDIPQELIYQTQYDLAQVLDMRGHWQEAKDIVSQLAEQCESVSGPCLAAEAHILAGWVSQKLGDMESAQQHYKRAATLVQSHRLPAIEARLLRKQAAWYSKQNLGDKVLECYQRALDLPQSLEDLVYAQIGYADNLRRRKRLDEAHSFMQMALEQCDKLPMACVAAVKLNAGLLSYNMRHFDESIQYLEHARDLAESVGAQWEQAVAENWLGTLYRYVDMIPSKRALHHYSQAIELYDLIGDKGAVTEVFRECMRGLVETDEQEVAVRMGKIASWYGIADSEIEARRQEAEAKIVLRQEKLIN